METDFLTMMLQLITIDKRPRLQCNMTREFMLGANHVLDQSGSVRSETRSLTHT